MMSHIYCKKERIFKFPANFGANLKIFLKKTFEIVAESGLRQDSLVQSIKIYSDTKQLRNFFFFLFDF